MDDLKDLLVQAIGEAAQCRIGDVASQLVYADSRMKELTLAELEFQWFLAEACLDCQGGR